MADEKKQEQVSEPTKGQKIADKFRKHLNQMTETERERHLRGAMAIIYGGEKTAVHAHRGCR